VGQGKASAKKSRTDLASTDKASAEEASTGNKKWTAEDLHDAQKYLAKHTASAQSASGCHLWTNQRAKFRKVDYPSGQTFAFAAQIQEPPLMQCTRVEAKCGNPLCITKDHLRLVYSRQWGLKAAHFPRMTADALVRLHRLAVNNPHICMNHAHIKEEEIRALYDAEKFVLLEQRLKPEV
jgi:hypothetical protein